MYACTRYSVLDMYRSHVKRLFPFYSYKGLRAVFIIAFVLLMIYSELLQANLMNERKKGEAEKLILWVL